MTGGSMVPLTYKLNKTTEFFYKICLIVYIFGFEDFWIEGLKLPKRFTRIFDKINVINNSLIWLLLFFEIGAFYTQDNLNKDQRLNLLVYIIAKFVAGVYILILKYYRKRVRNVLENLTMDLKAIYNDPAVETQMIKKSFRYLIAVTCNCVMAMFMIDVKAYMATVRNNVPFTTIVTVYPDVYDDSKLANTVRIITNIIFWMYLSRILGTYVLVTPLASALSHQYRNLRTYFYSLSEINERQDLNQKEREELYEKQFKLGIKMHLDTLWCTRQIHVICSGVFSGQILLNIFVLVLLMAQMVQSDRNLTNLLTTLITACAVLFTTGLFMWNAGDITVEASHLSTAIYLSGWHNCRGQSSTRIRKLVAITMTFAQRPVILKGLGYIDLSYQSYLNIVKSSYSLFSVLF